MSDKVKPWHRAHRRKHKEPTKRVNHKFHHMKEIEEEEAELPVPSSPIDERPDSQ